MDHYILRYEQWFPRPVSQVFDFFADARNLETITPPWLAFQIATPGSIPMRAGATITYRLRWHGVPIRWVTEIECWEPPFGFVDVQRQGPYALWHHTHAFEEHNGGTRMTDRVRYRLPLGLIGGVFHRLLVRRDLERIFDYRAQRVNELFGPLPIPQSQVSRT